MRPPIATGRVGVRPDIADMVDAAFAERTFVAQSKAGPAVLPSEAFMGNETITQAEHTRRHAATYGPVRDGGEVHPGTPPIPAVAPTHQQNSARTGSSQPGA